MTDTDKANALDWLNEIVTNPDGWRMFYSDSETKSCAEAAVELLKEQEAEGKWIYGEDETGVDGWHCSECGFFEPWFYEFTDDIDFIRFYGFCPNCGRKMTSYTGKSVQEGR